MLALELALSFTITWVLGLAPALIIRYGIKRRPIDKNSAGAISFVWCFLMFLIFRILTEVAPPDNGFKTKGLVWILVFFVSRRIMSRGAPLPVPVPEPVQKPKMSREEMVENLRAMVADPSTDEETRERAALRLSAMEVRMGLQPK